MSKRNNPPKDSKDPQPVNLPDSAYLDIEEYEAQQEEAQAAREAAREAAEEEVRSALEASGIDFDQLKLAIQG